MDIKTQAKHRISLIWIALMVSTSQMGVIAWAVDCKICDEKLSLMAEQAQQIKKNTEFLGKNRSYLAQLSPSEASKFLKLEGNIVLILQNLEANRKQLAKLEKDFQDAKCQSCSGSRK